MSKVRIRFVKLGKIRWTSHRDVARMWERAFRRAKLPLVYSAGFSPRPKVSFGLALPTGHESVAEYLDVELGDEPSVDIPALPGLLSAALPLGVEATAAELLSPGTPSLQEDVMSCTWRWAAAPRFDTGSSGPFAEGFEEVLRARVAAILSAPSLIVSLTRKGEQVVDDVRPGIHTLQLLGPAGPDPSHGLLLEAELACRPRTLRPSEVLVALDPGLEERQVRRTHQWIFRDGARIEPLREVHPPGATDAPHVLGRAS